MKIFRSRPTFGDVASATSHEIGARNAIEEDQDLKNVASVASHSIGARKAIEIFEDDQALEMLRVPLVKILAREMQSKFF